MNWLQLENWLKLIESSMAGKWRLSNGKGRADVDGSSDVSFCLVLSRFVSFCLVLSRFFWLIIIMSCDWYRSRLEIRCNRRQSYLKVDAISCVGATAICLAFIATTYDALRVSFFFPFPLASFFLFLFLFLPLFISDSLAMNTPREMNGRRRKGSWRRRRKERSWRKRWPKKEEKVRKKGRVRKREREREKEKEREREREKRAPKSTRTNITIA